MASGGTHLDEALLDRLRIRAADVLHRADYSDWATLASDPDVELYKTRDEAATFAIGRAGRPVKRNVEHSGPPPALPVDHVAELLDLAGLPRREDIVSLYSHIADGGFGPGTGLLPLKRALAARAEHMANPILNEWPDHLLPIVQLDGCDDCYNFNTGAIVRYNFDGALDSGGPRDEVSTLFEVGVSLAAYLGEWLDRPKRERTERFRPASSLGFTQGEVVVDMLAANELRQAIDALRDSEEARAAWDLPATGWESILCETRGLDPKIYLELIKRSPLDVD